MTWPEFIWFADPLHGGCIENQFLYGCNHGPPFDAPSRSLVSEKSGTKEARANGHDAAVKRHEHDDCRCFQR